MKYFSLFLMSALFINCSSEPKESPYNPEADSLKYEEEVHFRNVKQLTFGANNAEAYWGFEDTKLIFQSDNPEWGADCDQIYYMDATTPKDENFMPKMISTGNGRTTCSFFLPGDTTFVYGSTHLGNKECPAVPERGPNGAYVWPIYEDYDIFKANLEGEIIANLTPDSPGYDAEATLSPDGTKIVFTSMRTGDLELFIMNTDGSDVVQITDELGYDGGAFFSPDGTQLVFRSSRPKTPEEIEKYTSLLEQGLVEPTDMELYVVNVDGTGLRQVTDLGNANWAPYFHPSGEKILFASNHASERGFPFNLYMINVDGTGLKQVSFDPTFDSFPMFSYDGKKVVFASNRFNGGDRSTNVFIADWVD
ncbi:MAG: PD40 domain-containing protein [Balneolaceae bacterium]|nr:PD40 domain-containing protein [Balneolaceae bacterium]MBO6545025.1 PD40 domain-containing protein [Balneolaceae bacterium]MBO6646421.1 PD40 domain-containing protein [Balneolaceae bacterium]